MKAINYVFDWIKLVVMVIAGLVWIKISDFGCFYQILGMMFFLASAFVWAVSDQAARVIKNLID